MVTSGLAGDTKEINTVSVNGIPPINASSSLKRLELDLSCFSIGGARKHLDVTWGSKIFPVPPPERFQKPRVAKRGYAE